MKVTSIKRTLLFQELGNMTMTAKVDEGEDPRAAMKALEALMIESAEAFATRTYDFEQEERRCRVCGCTEDHACEGGCWCVEQDLCSACAGEVKKTDETSDKIVIDAGKVRDELILQLKRCEELLDEYDAIPQGKFGATMIRMDISSAKEALQEDDPVKMLVALDALKGCK